MRGNDSVPMTVEGQQHPQTMLEYARPVRRRGLSAWIEGVLVLGVGAGLFVMGMVALRQADGFGLAAVGIVLCIVGLPIAMTGVLAMGIQAVRRLFTLLGAWGEV